MDTSKIIEILTNLIDQEARASVGMLCAEIEVLEKNKSLSPILFKQLAKNTIYEQSRALKKLCKAIFIPSITFISKKDE